MYTTKRLLTIALLFTSTLFSLSAQEAPTMKWGEFKVEDLQLKKWATDTAAAAAILGDIGDITMAEVKNYYGFIFKQHRRIKIFKKEGFEQANISIPFYAKDETEFITSVRAQTIAVNGVKYPVDKKAIVYEKLNDKLSVAKFTFPNVSEGVILEYEFEMQCTRNLELREWYFQGSLPRRFSVLNADIWSRYEYTYLFQGKDQLKSTKPIYDNTSNRTAFSFYTLDLPGLKDEKFVTSIENHLVHIRFQLSKYWDTQTGNRVEVLSTWDKTADDLLTNESIGKKYLKKSNYSKVLEAAKGVVEPNDSARGKVQKLYDWVNKNIVWDGHYYLWSDSSPNDVWQKRKGGSSDINFLLLALLKEAGIEANPVLVSTREHGASYSEFPLIDQFNHALILVELENNQKMLVDAGNSALLMGLPSEQALNEKGWLLKKKAQQWLEIKPNMTNQVLLAKFEITNDGSFKGSINTAYKGYASVEQREIYKGDASGKYKVAYLKAKNTDWQVQELTCLNFEKPTEGLKENINLMILNAAQMTDDLIYVKPTLKSGWEANPFKQENRSFPVEFPYPTNDQYTLNLTIPEGYKVEEMPKAINLTLPPNDARFTYQIGNDEKIIKLVMRIQINKTTYPADEYKYLKNFFGNVSAKLEEMIVLKKIAK